MTMDKKALRRHYKAVRHSITCSEKTFADKKIFDFFVKSRYFNEFSTFLIYVSYDTETDTHNIINYLLQNRKRVAVPYCNGSVMTFYEINSLDDLVSGAFGIPTVNTENATEIKDYSGCLCIVPALAFDRKGNRLGYGGGYYDRFLAANKVATLGLCYDKCLAEELPAESFDVKIDSVLTENTLETLNKEASTYE